MSETFAFQLTTEEITLIRARRADQARIAKACEFRLTALETAARYGRWLHDEGRGTSFSAFVNEFGYESPDCQAMYAAVVALLDSPREDR
jgi:hypothetical protein